MLEAKTTVSGLYPASKLYFREHVGLKGKFQAGGCKSLVLSLRKEVGVMSYKFRFDFFNSYFKNLI